MSSIQGILNDKQIIVGCLCVHLIQFRIWYDIGFGIYILRMQTIRKVSSQGFALFIGRRR